MSQPRTSRVFTISFPADLARQVEQVAKQESRNISELFREAFRNYRFERIQRNMAMSRSAAAAKASRRFRQDDVEGFVDEVRSAFSKKRKS